MALKGVVHTTNDDREIGGLYTDNRGSMDGLKAVPESRQKTPGCTGRCENAGWTRAWGQWSHARVHPQTKIQPLH